MLLRSGSAPAPRRGTHPPNPRIGLQKQSVCKKLGLDARRPHQLLPCPSSARLALPSEARARAARSGCAAPLAALVHASCFDNQRRPTLMRRPPQSVDKPLMFNPALTTCASERMKARRFSYFTGFAAREQMR